jgi:DNA-directed RNA polymerase subunit K/omega
MSKLRRQLSGNTSSTIEPKKLSEMKEKTGNLYESIAIIAKRANQINISIKEELHNKLEEFASHTDSLEEIHENKEQIEISRAYERMPNPALLATTEFLEDKVYFRRKDKKSTIISKYKFVEKTESTIRRKDRFYIYLKV